MCFLGFYRPASSTLDSGCALSIAVVLGSEPRAPCIAGKHSTNRAKSPVPASQFNTQIILDYNKTQLTFPLNLSIPLPTLWHVYYVDRFWRENVWLFYCGTTVCVHSHGWALCFTEGESYSTCPCMTTYFKVYPFVACVRISSSLGGSHTALDVFVHRCINVCADPCFQLPGIYIQK